MKNMRKILKRGRSVLLNPDIDDLKETYTEFKNSSKVIKKKWKELLQPAEENCVGEREEMGVENIRDEADKKKKRKKEWHTLNEGEIMPDTRNEGTQKDRKKHDERDGDRQTPDKHDTQETEKINPANDNPIHTSFEGHPRYLCPSCDFIGCSYRKAYGHMVEMHNIWLLGCERCSFTTKNPTSLHNHRRLYCPKRKDK